MKGYFTREGKYGSAAGKSVVVTAEHVENETIFEIDSFYAEYFLEAGAFHAGGKKEEPGSFSADGLDDMKIDDLKAYAEEKEINLGDAKKKDDILAVIKESLKPAE